MKNLSWKQWVLLLLAIPVVNQISSYIGGSAGRYVSERDASVATPSTSGSQSLPPAIRVVVASQDAQGVTARDMDINFLHRLEQHTVESIKEKVRKGRAAQGYSGPDIELTPESVFVEAGANNLAVIRLHGSDNSFSVFVLGIVGNELKKVVCTRSYPEPIPITSGPCGEKVKEVFGAMIGG